ncbi:hypothetical protein MRB53_039229 [Persea americana]|nr:hypothetical protein MRB53_039229 [Persea americana]
MYMLGYIARDGRIYCADKDMNVSSYALSVAVVEYQSMIIRGDHEEAASVLETIPADQKNKIARFLEGQGLKELALTVATDDEHRFELALALSRLDIALEIGTRSALQKRKISALYSYCIPLLETPKVCLAGDACHRGWSKQHSLRSNLSLGQTSDCIDTLIKTSRLAEAALFARTYMPSRIDEIVTLRRKHQEEQLRHSLLTHHLLHTSRAFSTVATIAEIESAIHKAQCRNPRFVWAVFNFPGTTDEDLPLVAGERIEGDKDSFEDLSSATRPVMSAGASVTSLQESAPDGAPEQPAEVQAVAPHNDSDYDEEVSAAPASDKDVLSWTPTDSHRPARIDINAFGKRFEIIREIDRLRQANSNDTQAQTDGTMTPPLVVTQRTNGRQSTISPTESATGAMLQDSPRSADPGTITTVSNR